MEIDDSAEDAHNPTLDILVTHLINPFLNQPYTIENDKTLREAASIIKVATLVMQTNNYYKNKIEPLVKTKCLNINGYFVDIAEHSHRFLESNNENIAKTILYRLTACPKLYQMSTCSDISKHADCKFFSLINSFMFHTKNNMIDHIFTKKGNSCKFYPIFNLIKHTFYLADTDVLLLSNPSSTIYEFSLYKDKYSVIITYKDHIFSFTKKDPSHITIKQHRTPWTKPKNSILLNSVTPIQSILQEDVDQAVNQLIITT
jgi:hypothetical protein